METLGLAALFARCGDGNGVIESLVALPVHSLQLNSDADLLKCFRSDEQRDSKFNLDFSAEKFTTEIECELRNLFTSRANDEPRDKLNNFFSFGVCIAHFQGNFSLFCLSAKLLLSTISIYQFECQSNLIDCYQGWQYCKHQKVKQLFGILLPI